jgi:hypothetical protein
MGRAWVWGKENWTTELQPVGMPVGLHINFCFSVGALETLRRQVNGRQGLPLPQRIAAVTGYIGLRPGLLFFVEKGRWASHNPSSWLGG